MGTRGQALSGPTGVDPTLSASEEGGVCRLCGH